MTLLLPIFDTCAAFGLDQCVSEDCQGSNPGMAVARMQSLAMMKTNGSHPHLFTLFASFRVWFHT